MRYWVYGVDSSSKQPRDPAFIEAESEEAARAQATAAGMQVEEIEPVQPRSPVPAPDVSASGQENAILRFLQSEYALARGLIVGLRVLAVLAVIWWLWNTAQATEVAGSVEARAKEMDRIAPGAGKAAVSEANRALFSALVTGVALVMALLALAEGLRLAIAIEGHTRGEQRGLSREKRKRR